MLDSKPDLVTETLVLILAPKFLWLIVHFDKQFWFWYETEIVPKNLYSGMWPFLEIHTLNSLKRFSRPSIKIQALSLSTFTDHFWFSESQCGVQNKERELKRYEKAKFHFWKIIISQGRCLRKRCKVCV